MIMLLVLHTFVGAFIKANCLVGTRAKAKRYQTDKKTLIMILCSQFWADFWPNFVSTLVGLLIGLPIALWTNRIIIIKESKKQKVVDSNRLKKALTIIKQTLQENRERILNTKNILEDNKVQLETEFDTSAWDSVKTDIIQFLHDPELQKQIAYHFSRLVTLVKLNEMYLDSATGMTATLTGIQTTKDALKNHILKNINFLTIDTDKILQKIEDIFPAD
jgi:hypothetical protein